MGEFKNHIKGLVWLAVCSAVTIYAQPVIDSIADVRNLPAAEAAKLLPVRVEAQILYVGPNGSSLFVLEEGKGTYVHTGLDPVEYDGRFKAGDWVRIEGTTVRGEFYPAIDGHNIEVLRSGVRPPPRPFLLEELHRPSSDCDWVSVEGRLTGMTSESELHSRMLLTLELHESIQIGVQLIVSEEAKQRIPELMFHRVRVNGVVGTLYNTQRQLTGRTLLLNSINDIELLTNEEAWNNLQSLPIHSLMRVGVDHKKAVRTQGRVTYASPREIFLRGEKASLKVAVLNGDALQVGQEVEAVGFVWPQPISPAFRARTVRVLGQEGFAPEPMDISLEELLGTGQPEDLLNPRMNYELVRIQAQLVDIGKSFGQTSGLPEDSGRQSLLCRSENHLFEARLPVGMQAGGQLLPGAVLELTGICNLMQNKSLQWRLYVEGLWLQVRNEGDIVVLRPAPWWTPKRMLWISAVALGLASLFLVWVAALRKTVDRQTGIIRKKIERETVLNERQRVARELHDNLDQGLTGAAIHLQGCRKFLETRFTQYQEAIKAAIKQLGDNRSLLTARLRDLLSAMEKASETSQGELKSVQAMLAYCGDESRSQILDLRGGLLERMDLPAALQEALTPFAAECTAELTIQIDGPVRRLKLIAERNLLLIAKEATINAARHAAPEHIHVHLVFGGSSLMLRVKDDGRGSSADQLSRVGHFGMQGMRERAVKLGAELLIESSPEEGTVVTVDLPSTAEWELELPNV